MWDTNFGVGIDMTDRIWRMKGREESGMIPIFLALETGCMVVQPAIKLRKYRKNHLRD